jgi:hypothetical protein
MTVFFCPDRLRYDGSQLRSHWAYERFGLTGDVLVYFLGPCQVQPEFMVDLVDRRQGAVIQAAEMLHFLAEHFDPDLLRAVLRQRLLAAVAAETLGQLLGHPLQRRGDDLYWQGRKLSVSIATVSPVSALVHFGLNVDASGAPVLAADLQQLGLDPAQVGERIAQRYAEEIEQLAAACTRVRWVV